MNDIPNLRFVCQNDKIHTNDEIKVVLNKNGQKEIKITKLGDERITSPPETFPPVQITCKKVEEDLQFDGSKWLHTRRTTARQNDDVKIKLEINPDKQGNEESEKFLGTKRKREQDDFESNDNKRLRNSKSIHVNINIQVDVESTSEEIRPEPTLDKD